MAAADTDGSARCWVPIKVGNDVIGGVGLPGSPGVDEECVNAGRSRTCSDANPDFAIESAPDYVGCGQVCAMSALPNSGHSTPRSAIGNPR
jgi:hypothetical protein